MKTSTLDKDIESLQLDFFKEVRGLVKKESLYKTWFSKTELRDNDENELVLSVPHEFSKNWIQKKYMAGLSEISNRLVGKRIVLEVRQQNADKMAQKQLVSVREPQTDCENKVSKRALVSEFSLDDFIAGSENQLALVAAKNFMRSKFYHSPFVIIGGHGVGKTHLALGAVSGTPCQEVFSMRAEEFANAYILAAKEGQLDSFRASIRSKKYFILEDLDFFLEGQKKKTVDELMNTLKVLQRENRQIILTSSKFVHEFREISPRLADFLLSGLKVRLSAPSILTRRELILRFINEHGKILLPKSISFIEEIPFKSLRDLVGALKQIQMYASLGNSPLELNVIKDLLTDHFGEWSKGESEEGIDLQDIGKCVAEMFGVQMKKLISSSRERHISLARHTAMSLSYDQHFTLKQIGHFYGGRLHQSVLFAIQKIQKKRQKEVEFKAIYDKLVRQIRTRVSESR